MFLIYQICYLIHNLRCVYDLSWSQKTTSPATINAPLLDELEHKSYIVGKGNGTKMGGHRPTAIQAGQAGAIFYYVFPISPGKMEQVKQFVSTLTDPTNTDFNDHCKRYGISSFTFGIEHTPPGDMLHMHHEHVVGGTDEVSYIFEVAKSTHPFDISLRNNVQQVFGIDLTKPEDFPTFDFIKTFTTQP